MHYYAEYAIQICRICRIGEQNINMQNMHSPLQVCWCYWQRQGYRARLPVTVRVADSESVQDGGHKPELAWRSTPLHPGPILSLIWNPQKVQTGYMSVIYLSYDMSCRIPVIWQVYDKILFLTKFVFISYRMDTLHPSELPIYRTSLSMHGVYFLESYKVSKINMEYDSHVPYIWMVYIRIIMILYPLLFSSYAIMKLPPQV